MIDKLVFNAPLGDFDFRLYSIFSIFFGSFSFFSFFSLNYLKPSLSIIHLKHQEKRLEIEEKFQII